MIQKRTVCNRDCPDTCGIIATIEDGRITRLQGDPEHPVTRGFLCHRTSRFLDRHYSSERLTRPLIRQGDRFEETDWPAALDLVANKLAEVRRESGGESILHYRSGGSMGMLKLVTDYFFDRFGPVTIKSGDICDGAGNEAQMQDFGLADSHDLFDLLNSRTIILWGKNLVVSNVHLIPIIKQARAAGTRVVLIDPIHHATRNFCDRYLQPRPGGDIALALGMARWLLDHDRWDAKAAEYCDHFDEFVAIVRSRTVRDWAKLADVNATELEELADWYADRPAAILMGWGMQRRARGCSTIRAIDALAAISGNLGLPGGGASFKYNRRSAFDLSFMQRDGAAPRTIPEAMLGQGILSAADPPIRVVWVTAANPVAMLPDSVTVAKALRTREMTVVVDSFLTDTAQQADIVLPTTTMLEEDDILAAYGHHFLAESRPVVDASTNVRSDLEIVQELNRRLQVGREFQDNAETWKRRMLRPVKEQGVSLEVLREQSAVRNPRAAKLLFEDRKFPTETGRVNLVTKLDPSPPCGTPQRPLLLMALSVKEAQSSQWVVGSDEGVLVATVHPMAATGFAEGELVTIDGEKGQLTAQLRFDEKQRRDVLLVPKGGWLSKGHCANAIIPAAESDGGGCANYHNTPVRILKRHE